MHRIFEVVLEVNTLVCNPKNFSDAVGLFVTMNYRVNRFQVAPKDSRFMAIKPAFAQGAQVDHPKFGLGSVLSCNEEYIVIKFDDHGEKKFVLSIVMPNLKKSDRVPPAEKRRSSKKKVAAAVPAAK